MAEQGDRQGKLENPGDHSHVYCTARSFTHRELGADVLAGFYEEAFVFE